MSSRSGIQAPLARAANIVMLALFLFAAILQYNDPDPIRWMAVYGLAAAACLLALFGRLWTLPLVFLALAGLVWAVTLAVKVIGRQSLVDSEDGREMLGLLLVFGWMTYLAVESRRPRGAQQPSLT